MRVILFIGHHKVGTSSLQHYLAENYHAFLKEGILYPMVDFEGFSIQMARKILGDDDGPALSFNAREAHNALAFKMMAEEVKKLSVPKYHKSLPHTQQMFHAIYEQVAAFNPHTVVLCAEVFANFAATSQLLIKKLAEVFDPQDVTIISTLRRPDEYVSSWQGQRLKFGHHMAPLSGEGLDHYFPTIHFDYQKMLEGWAEEFPRDVSNWVLRDYADVLESGGSIQDFMTQTGIPRVENAIDVPNSNPSIPFALMEIARVGNNVLPAVDAGSLRRYLINVNQRVNLPSNSDVELFGADNRRRLLERFAPIHDWISGFTQSSPFFRDMNKVEAVRPIPALEAALSVIEELRSDANEHLMSDDGLSFLTQFNGENV